MATPNETTLVSLFTNEDHARQAMNDLQGAGIPTQSIQSLGGSSASSAPEQSLTALQTLNLPAHDLQLLSDGLKQGGTLLVVRTDHQLAERVEDIFEAHHAGKVDERTRQANPAAVAGHTGSMTDETVIPVVEEQLVVGKRRVERGGVRVFTRMVETPVEEQITLREEHATFERHAVNRPISEAELDALQNQSIEVRETGEEAVVGKTARVVEEVHIGKDSSERTEQIHDTVRKTEVEVDQIAADTSNATTEAARQKALGATKT